MPKYKSFPENKEVVDVLCCIIDGCNKVKDIVKKLKQPQSTVSEKMRFLLKSKAIKKNKWVFEPNWDVLIKIFQREIRNFMGLEKISLKEFSKADGDENKILLKELKIVKSKIPNIFNEKRVTLIYKTYADYVLEEWLEKFSISALAGVYYHTLNSVNTEILKKLDSGMVSIRKLYEKIYYEINVRNMKEELFVQVEREMRR